MFVKIIKDTVGVESTVYDVADAGICLYEGEVYRIECDYNYYGEMELYWNTPQVVIRIPIIGQPDISLYYELVPESYVRIPSYVPGYEYKVTELDERDIQHRLVSLKPTEEQLEECASKLRACLLNLNTFRQFWQILEEK